MWFNPIPNDADRTKFVEAAKITDANNFRNYFYYTNTNEKTTSDTYALEEGKLYYVESF